MQEVFERVVKLVVLKYSQQRSKEDLEDFEQECWLALYSNTDKFDGLDVERSKKLAYTICKRAVYDYATRNLPPKSDISLDDLSYGSLSDVLDVDELLDYGLIIEKIDQLPAMYREILKWRFGINREKESLMELAERFNTSSWYIHRKEKKALELLRRRIGNGR